MASPDTVSQLTSAAKGFDHLFADEIANARKSFTEEAQTSPFHSLGLAVCGLLETAFGIKSDSIENVAESLAFAEQAAKKHMKTAKANAHRFPPGTEWQVLHADTVVLLSVVYELRETYMGYAQCIYAMNSAHSKFTKLFKTVFPAGLEPYLTNSSSQNASTLSLPMTSSSKPSLFGLWSSSSENDSLPIDGSVNGEIEEFIVAGTAFGFGTFSLVVSMLPASLQSVFGFFGFKHDRTLALQALSVATARNDIHATLAGLVLTTYYGFTLFLCGYHADEARVIKQCRAIVTPMHARYPYGSLWILNRAKILRATNSAEEAIRMLQDGISPHRPHRFDGADNIMMFELAWTLLTQRKYIEAGKMFSRLKSMNTWSGVTYDYLVAGCFISLGQISKAQSLLDKISPRLKRKKKMLPMEKFIGKKLAFYVKKQLRRGGTEAQFAKVIKISPAEEIGFFFHIHSRSREDVIKSRILEWSMLTPPVTIPSPLIFSPAVSIPSDPPDLDTPDELALRSLLLGVVHCTLGYYDVACAFLDDALESQGEAEEVSKWITATAIYHHAVLVLLKAEKETAPEELPEEGASSFKDMWEGVLAHAGKRLEEALALAEDPGVDVSETLVVKIGMLKDEIVLKKKMLEVA